ncbi:MAG: ATP-binding domain-containing protein, partial [Muribaculaceae bacterium]|nr:ATP-binding domain-containing protein [Muribaculaceae bacterium]
LYFPDHDSYLNAKINLDTLTTDTANLPYEQQRKLVDMAMAAAGLGASASPTAVREALKADPWFNALQVKYAYAVTCHKAQGGQWSSVFVDMGYIPPEAYTSLDFYRWLYTATSRATKRLSLVNPSIAIT